MSWITEIPPDRAEGRLLEIYRELQARRGKVANILQVHSLRPEALAAHLTLYMDLLFAPGGLSRKQREMIAVVVSRANNCTYCVAHHAEALSRYFRNQSELEQFANDHHSVELSPSDRALLDYAVQLTVAPATLTRESVERLRRFEFTSADILLANLIAAYFNFVNRIALGLGVEFTVDEVSGYHDKPAARATDH
jgi:uncharacterized peroxidase-related enzyme